jgi:hypothetical protein
VSIKAYGWFISDLNVFEAMNLIKETINPVFLNNTAQNIKIAADAVLQAGSKEITWNDTDLRCFGSDLGKQVLPKKKRIGRLGEELLVYTEGLRQTEAHTFSDADIGYEVIMLPGPNKGGVVFRVFSVSSAYTRVLAQQEWCSDFSYWNNTDRDKSISEEEWERREVFWRSLPMKAFKDMSLSFCNPSPFETLANLQIEGIDVEKYLFDLSTK